MEIAIAADGTVSSVADVSEPAFPDRGMSNCVLNAVRGIVFPSVDRPTKVSYALHFDRH